MSLDNLPVEWLLTELNQVLSVKNGYAFKSKDYISEKTSDDLVPVIRISDIKDNSVSTLKSVFVEKAKASENFKIDKGDLLIAMSGATTGKTGIFREENPAFLNQRVGNLKVHSQEYFLPKFRNFLIQNLSNQILENAYGGAQPNISSKDIESLKFGLPPLAEQQEIVRQLDVMLAQVEQIKARLDAIPAILKKFRQSVLADAVSGKLTEEWRSQNNIEDWKWETWFDITTKSKDAFKRGPFGSSLKKSMFVEQGFKVYEQYCPINDDCSYARYYITPEKFEEMKEFEVKDGDFLISCSGVSLGRITQVPLNSERGIINQALLRVRLDNSKYDSDFFKILFRSPTFQKVIFENSTGSAIPNLKAAKLLKQIPVPMPNLMEQENIVTRVYELYRSISLIEESVQSAQKRVNLLTQSILAKAFSGELTAEWREQHQELITGVNSAESLLAKIQAEREASKPAKKTRKKKEV